jgi:hypothetical protein
MVLVIVLPFSDVVFGTIEVCVTKIVAPGWVAVDVLTKLVTVKRDVMVVVLAAARGITAPRRTKSSAAAVGIQDAVIVDFFVVVLYETVVMVMELCALTVVVFVLLGWTEIVVLMVVEAPFGKMELVTRTVEPWLVVIVAALGVEVYTDVTVVLNWIVRVVGASVVTPPSVMVALTTLVFVIGSGVTVRPTFSTTTFVVVEVTSGDVIETVAVAFCTLVFTTSTPEIVSISVTLRIVVFTTSGAVMRVLAVSFSTVVAVV